MLRVPRRYRCWALAGLVVCIIVIIDWDISFYPVIPNQSQSTEYRQTNKECCGLFKGPIIGGAPIWIPVAVDWADRHEPFITAFATVAIAAFTLTLWLATRGLFRMAARQDVATRRSLRISREAANAAKKSADAAIASAAPFLHPRITKVNLYPDVVNGESEEHIARIWITFDNIGKTPAMLQLIGARLQLLTKRQESNLPEPSPVPLPPDVERSDAIAPGSCGGDREWSFARPITPAEIRRLNAEGEDADYLRFYIFGNVIYDDVFGYRAVRRFCIKVRQNGFQAIRGGQRHNSTTRYKAPE